MPRLAKWLLPIGLIALALPAQAIERFRANSYLGAEPPELLADGEHWVNRPVGLTLAGLKGRVVWLEFNF